MKVEIGPIYLIFFKSSIEPKEDSTVLFWEFGTLKIGSFIDGKFYSDGQIYFPDSWAYKPKEPKFIISDVINELEAKK